MAEIRPRRSVLVVSGADPAGLRAAQDLPADAVILDLEDTVAHAAKAQARAAVADLVAARALGRRETVVRINPLEGPHGEADLAAVAPAVPDAILVPKVSRPDRLVAVGARLRRHGAPTEVRVWAMIETPLAVLKAGAIASAARDVDARLAALVVDAGGLAAATRAPGDARAALRPWLAATVAAARAYEIDALTTVGAAPGEALPAECEAGRELGFDGTLVYGADQIATANAAFAPDPARIAAAARVAAAFAEADGAAAILREGRMIGRAHLDEARRVLALADALGPA